MTTPLEFLLKSMPITLLLVTISLLMFLTPPSHAVREGTANANIMIQRYERRGDYARAALWREAAAECLEVISIPMTEILNRYAERHGRNTLAEIGRKELADIQKQRRYHLQLAQANRQRAKPLTDAELADEREKIAKFIATWVPVYPNKFYAFGIYRTFFQEQIELRRNASEYAAALNLEADAAEMRAEQYDRIPVAYFNEHSPEQAKPYEEIRDAHRRRAALLRALAERNPTAWPPEAEKVVPLDKGDHRGSREITPPETKTALTPTQVIRIANSQPRIQEILERHTGVREYAWFQGFAWTVSYYNHGWGNLGIVLVDDTTGKVVDILNSVDNLEAREWDDDAREPKR